MALSTVKAQAHLSLWFLFNIAQQGGMLQGKNIVPIFSFTRKILNIHSLASRCDHQLTKSRAVLLLKFSLDIVGEEKTDSYSQNCFNFPWNFTDPI